MDAINYKIFRELQQNGRLTNEELSARVNLSPSPCLRPLRMLEQSGGLRGCTALVDQEAFGLPITGSIPTKIKHRVFGTRTPSFAVGSNEIAFTKQGALVHGSAPFPALVYDTETFSRTLGMTWDGDTRSAAN